MAERNLWTRLREAIFGQVDWTDRVIDVVNSDVDPRRSMVRFLKQLPSDDESKKEELKKFFQTPEGLRYSRSERKQAYDDLLGVDRNRETIG